MADYRLLFPSLYLGAPDLKGKDVTLTIRRVVVQDLKTEKGTERKPMLFFNETKDAAEAAGELDKEKRMVLNKTNAKTIASLYGNDADAWAGKRVTLFPSMVAVGGESKDCLRIRPVQPPPVRAAAPEKVEAK